MSFSIQSVLCGYTSIMNSVNLLINLKPVFCLHDINFNCFCIFKDTMDWQCLINQREFSYISKCKGELPKPICQYLYQLFIRNVFQDPKKLQCLWFNFLEFDFYQTLTKNQPITDIPFYLSEHCQLSNHNICNFFNADTIVR